jgi:hypothetical protein
VARNRLAPKLNGGFSHFATLTDFTRMCKGVGRNIKKSDSTIPEVHKKFWGTYL